LEEKDEPHGRVSPSEVVGCANFPQEHGQSDSTSRIIRNNTSGEGNPDVALLKRLRNSEDSPSACVSRIA
jgi:hypothetical protein